MIVAERKPFEEILELTRGYSRLLLVGCGECVTVCCAGGEREVAALAAGLKTRARLENRTLTIIEHTVKRQCDREFLEPLDELVEDIDMVLSLACGAGVQLLAEQFFPLPVKPALNTQFMGITVEPGQWSERCAGCGDCRLHLFAGICPITRCSKGLLNGPCGGSMDGHCEVDPDIQCAWQLIHDRLAAAGLLESCIEITPPNDWSTSRAGGPRRVIREDLQR
ncbi:methylenetetrahydrofolate reductase C-terminal domain-containing protein [bacterium]|nr:methylenetetrahydrofolate reductase C-terminal domain-containing protein [candidate division CSSED10-310 bacterium]